MPKLIPVPDTLSQPFWDAVNQRRLVLQHCAQCDRLQYPPSSATVLLKNLTDLGYLSYDRGAREYFPTLRVASLGDWINHELFGRGEIFELMQDLHSATGEAVSIALQNDIHLQYIRVIQSIHPLRFHTEEGSLRPLTQSVTGWLILTLHTERKSLEEIFHKLTLEPDQSPTLVLPADRGIADTEQIEDVPGIAAICDNEAQTDDTAEEERQ